MIAVLRGLCFRRASCWIACAVACLHVSVGVAPAADWRFEVRFSKEVRAEPFSGRVYVFFSDRDREPRFGPNWFRPGKFIARDVVDWKPGEPLLFDTNQPEGLLAFPEPLSEMRLAGYRAQAVARFAPHERDIGTGPGNGYGAVRLLDAPPAGDETVRLSIDAVVPRPEFRETRWTKLLEVESKLLSEFHGRPVKLSAAVVLPASYHAEPDRRYPTIFTIPGFGGTHLGAIAAAPIQEENAEGVEFLRVVLDPSCPLGHHVFADSANNGPVGRALVAEFLPAFDRAFRSIPEPTARFLTGHSSGGWSSLWLQIAYPDTFGGVWSTAPDPVDFRDFQRIDLYRPEANLYVDENGNRRPLARRGGRVLAWFREFDRMERVLGHGGQLHSFEAVFSPRGEDGRPLPLWDRRTGAIDPEVARAWRKYDIRLVLEQDWETFGPKLAGKLHVIAAEQDTFYLEGAVRLLKESLQRLGSDAVVEIVPRRDHSNLLTPELRARIQAEMVAAFLAHHRPGRPGGRR